MVSTTLTNLLQPMANFWVLKNPADTRLLQMILMAKMNIQMKQKLALTSWFIRQKILDENLATTSLVHSSLMK